MSSTEHPASPHATELLGTGADDVARAAELLRGGGLVAVPTETVYGLAVRADDADAVARLFAAKGRPADNPLIVHVADVADVALVARTVTPLARRLLERFAPGPLTVVLEARDDLPRAVTGGLDTVAVRVPDHPVALALLRAAAVPLAAPSANRSGRPSPTRAEHVLDDLAGRIDAVVDAGPTRVGLESTVVDTRGERWHVLREGGISTEQLAAELGAPSDGAAQDPQHAPDTQHAPHAQPLAPALAPGLRHRHYAPSLPVHLAAPGAGAAVAARLGAAGRVRVVAEPDARRLAADLFALLREAEADGLDALVVERVAEEGVGRAVMDRLRRAADASGGSVS